MAQDTENAGAHCSHHRSIDLCQADAIREILQPRPTRGDEIVVVQKEFLTARRTGRAIVSVTEVATANSKPIRAATHK
jgi:hypothetical protein